MYCSENQEIASYVENHAIWKRNNLGRRTPIPPKKAAGKGNEDKPGASNIEK